MKKRVMGRPPADWVYRVLKLKNKPDEMYTFEELAEKLQTTSIAVQSFCSTRNIQGNYVLIEKRNIKKIISIKELKIAAKKTVDNYDE